MSSTADTAAVPARPPRWVLPVALVPIITLVIAGYVAGGSWATLIGDRSGELALIALSPINRYLLLATQHVPWHEFFAVAMLRHLVPDPFFYLLGWHYGDRALAWAAETYPSVHRIIGEDRRGLEDPAHRKILYPLAFFVPNNWVSLLAGVARIRVQTFLVLNFVGTLARVALCWWLGSVFHDEIRSIAEWVGRYQWPATIASVVVVLLGIAFQFRRGTGQLVGLTHLSEELEDEPAAES